MSSRITKHFSLLLVFCLLFTACNLAGPEKTEAVQPQVSQALPLVETSVSIAPPSAPPSTETQQPAVTSTLALLPTSTYTFAPTETPSATTTPTPVYPIASVSENTNCRSGPSTLFSAPIVILKGEAVKIVSRTTLESYLVVEDPQNPGETCWLWTRYVSITGDISTLPVVTPPPVPLNFKLKFIKVEVCTLRSLVFEIVNTGTLDLQSYKIVAKDLTANTQETTTGTTFKQRSGCADAADKVYVKPGDTGYVYADDFSYDPSGHSMEAEVEVCGKDEDRVVCDSRTIQFTP